MAVDVNEEVDAIWAVLKGSQSQFRYSLARSLAVRVRRRQAHLGSKNMLKLTEELDQSGRFLEGAQPRPDKTRN